MYRFALSVIILTLWVNIVCNAQVAYSMRLPNIRFDVTGGFYHQISAEEGLPTIKLPTYLSNRRPQEPDIASLWGLNGDYATDSPLAHGASYWRLHTWYSLASNLEIYGSLEVDHRGFSFSAYNTEQVAILPRYNVKFQDSFLFHPLQDSVQLKFEVGTWENFRSFEGLMMYNLDVQGLQGSLAYKDFTFSISTVADLQFGIGLNVDGLITYQLAYDTWFRKRWSLSVESGIYDLKDDDFAAKIDITSLAINARNSTYTLYAAWGYRLTSPYPSLVNHGLVVGLTRKYKQRKVDVLGTLEYRWYGGGFNAELRNETATHYRKTDQMPGGNYIGDHVYPLSFLSRPFSQWAVFTEYDKRWVSGLSFVSSTRFKVARSINAIIETDLNLITAENEDPFLYPFFKVGPSISAFDNTYMTFSITNKTMNLDKHYPTYYLLTRPVFQIELRRDLK
jgi:hypothetical protein